jgi:AbrB family looped-hinge helix DNA binding protein
MPISKLGVRRQIVIPKDICDALGLAVGDCVEVQRVQGMVVIKPKKPVEAEDVLRPEEEKIVRQGERQLRQGKSTPWRELKHALAR